MSYEFYKVLHIGSILFVFTSLGGAAFLAGQGGETRGSHARKLASMLHGAGLLVALIAGFGLLARLGLMGSAFPFWVWAKLVIWLCLGGALTLAFRKPGAARIWAVLFPLLGVLAALFAVYKPGS